MGLPDLNIDKPNQLNDIFRLCILTNNTLFWPKIAALPISRISQAMGSLSIWIFSPHHADYPKLSCLQTIIWFLRSQCLLPSAGQGSRPWLGPCAWSRCPPRISPPLNLPAGLLSASPPVCQSAAESPSLPYSEPGTVSNLFLGPADRLTGCMAFLPSRIPALACVSAVRLSGFPAVWPSGCVVVFTDWAKVL